MIKSRDIWKELNCNAQRETSRDPWTKKRNECVLDASGGRKGKNWKGRINACTMPKKETVGSVEV